MPDGIYLDNDIILKTCIYLVAAKLLEAISTPGNVPAMLAVSQYTLQSHFERHSHDPSAFRMLTDVMHSIQKLEPTPEEIEAAANFEGMAIKANVDLDPGESQLLAMAISRDARALATGDKRAVRALFEISPDTFNHRIACLEQTIAHIVRTVEFSSLRTAVCRNSLCDKAVSICFQCGSGCIDANTVIAALRSYIEDLRSRTGHLLISGDDLSSVVS